METKIHLSDTDIGGGGGGEKEDKPVAPQPSTALAASASSSSSSAPPPSVDNGKEEDGVLPIISSCVDMIGTSIETLLEATDPHELAIFKACFAKGLDKMLHASWFKIGWYHEYDQALPVCFDDQFQVRVRRLPRAWLDKDHSVYEYPTYHCTLVWGPNYEDLDIGSDDDAPGYDELGNENDRLLCGAICLEGWLSNLYVAYVKEQNQLRVGGPWCQPAVAQQLHVELTTMTFEGRQIPTTLVRIMYSYLNPTVEEIYQNTKDRDPDFHPIKTHTKRQKIDSAAALLASSSSSSSSSSEKKKDTPKRPRSPVYGQCGRCGVYGNVRRELCIPCNLIMLGKHLKNPNRGPYSPRPTSPDEEDL